MPRMETRVLASDTDSTQNKHDSSTKGCRDRGVCRNIKLLRSQGAARITAVAGMLSVASGVLVFWCSVQTSQTTIMFLFVVEKQPEVRSLLRNPHHGKKNKQKDNTVLRLHKTTA